MSRPSTASSTTVSSDKNAASEKSDAFELAVLERLIQLVASKQADEANQDQAIRAQ